MAKKCFLCFSGETLDDAKKYRSISDAVDAFLITARELDQFGQRIGASIHIANNRAELSEYSDYILSLGPRSGLVKERT